MCDPLEYTPVATGERMVGGSRWEWAGCVCHWPSVCCHRNACCGLLGEGEVGGGSTSHWGSSGGEGHIAGN